MRFQFCPHCGTRAVLKEIGDEGMVPWCPECRLPLFPMFSTCIIALAVDEQGEVGLLRQGYISSQYHLLVSGYMKTGEAGEEGPGAGKARPPRGEPKKPRTQKGFACFLILKIFRF